MPTPLRMLRSEAAYRAEVWQDLVRGRPSLVGWAGEAPAPTCAVLATGFRCLSLFSARWVRLELRA